MERLNRGRIRYLLAVWLIVAAVLSGHLTVLAAGDDFFSRQEIDITGAVLGSRVGDCNGDGKIDVILIVDEPSGQRAAKIYLQREADRFPPTAGQTLALPSSTNLVQVVDLDGDNRAELVTVDHDGLWIYRHDGQQYLPQVQPTTVVATIFTNGIERGILAQDFIRTIGGRPVALIPVAEGYSLWEFRQGKFQALGQMGVNHMVFQDERPVKQFGGQTGGFAMSLADMVIGDANNDRRDDIYLLWPDRLAVFCQNASGGFDNPPKISLRFQQTAGDFCQAQLADLDRDGRLDLICSRSLGGISGAHTEIDFYGADGIAQGRLDGGQHVTLTDACGNLMVDNLDRTGGLELIVPAIELGIMSTVKTMITGRTDFYLLIYPIDNLGHPAKEPAVRRKLSCRPSFDQPSPTSTIRVDLSGDFDGDGLPDVAFADGDGQLSFYRGASGEYIQTKASLVLDMPDPDRLQSASLNGDGRSDLIVIHKLSAGNCRVTLLVTNRVN
ncbi:MAG: VCBS repeat-containing protein [candidate division Zixibacteria bacterium]|nr:VCBS repeat-containing protein [candidate division Zixibacteria bacterium]